MIDYYRDLLRRHAWLEESLCWLVVQPLDEDLTRDDVLWRLNGGRDPEQRIVPDPVDANANMDGELIFAFEGDGAWGFLDWSGVPASDEIVAALSEDCRVWLTSWNFSGQSTLLYAAGGRIRTRVHRFHFARHITEEGDPAAVAGLHTLLGGVPHDDYTGRRAAALAFVEASTGVAIESERFDEEEGPVIILDTRGDQARGAQMAHPPPARVRPSLPRA
ncbi:hypothetical protein Nocox_06445 [Nonomuraea coxensis DSM 45129]|uniref:Uncharacterized protein n=1 Tax=Nonomuraea coxensis DSM 45129 TaxID=1122611 RepID=A0ABX8TTX9_9ACTN|nr:hypothetical protein [Nonomuraea coxensis]QYC38916.1 hypothetical protein Nocox_06445 [Nonomuraea coxensis DSM 45129]